MSTRTLSVPQAYLSLPLGSWPSQTWNSVVGTQTVVGHRSILVPQRRQPETKGSWYVWWESSSCLQDVFPEMWLMSCCSFSTFLYLNCGSFFLLQRCTVLLLFVHPHCCFDCSLKVFTVSILLRVHVWRISAVFSRVPAVASSPSVVASSLSCSSCCCWSFWCFDCSF